MAGQKIKQGNIWGRIGSGVGQGLAEQIPKEIERSRLASGLKELGEKKDLDPWQGFVGLASTPGVTPQMIQTGGEILKQRGVGQGLQKQAEISPFEQYKNVPQPQAPDKSITTKQPTKATTEPYIPPTREQELAFAGQLYDQNRPLYPTPEAAMMGAQRHFQQQEAINKAEQAQRLGQQDVQRNIETRMATEKKLLGANVPGNVESEIRDKAVGKVKDGELSEEDAGKWAGKELDKVSRQYKAVQDVGSKGFVFRPGGAKEIKRQLNEIRKDFKERDDLENLADTYIAEQHLSPGKAYYLAYPPSDIKELNNTLANLKPIKPFDKSVWKNPNLSFEEIEKKSAEHISNETDKVLKAISTAMGKEGSPLAIGEELKARGYDADRWFDYLGKNRKSLDLTERQARELSKDRNVFHRMNDTWLFMFSGLDKLVEQ